MRVARRVFAASTFVALAAAGCSKKPQEPASSQTPAQAEATEAAPEPTPKPRPDIERYRVAASIEQLGDMLDGIGKLSPWVTEEPIDPRAELQALLLGMGFGPGFFKNLDLEGVHALEFRYPHEGQPARPSDSEMAARMAVVDPRKVLENMPASVRPQPLGGGMWEVILEGQDMELQKRRILVREQADSLELGFDQEDLDRADALGPPLDSQRRVQFELSNLSRDEIDPSGLFGLPPDSKLAEQIAHVARNMRSLSAQLDFGTERDLQALLSLHAPLSELGLDPLGPPRTEAATVESHLPGDPALVGTLSWGDPKLLHELIDRQIPLDRIPQPFVGLVKSAMTHTHALLDQVSEQAVLAVYLSARGEATVVVASSVKDEAATKKALRGLNETLADAGETQRKLAGKAKSSQFRVRWKPDGLRLPKGRKADRLSIEVAKDFEKDVRPMQMFLDRDRLDSFAIVHDGIAAVAIGAGAKTIVTRISRGPSRKLAQDPGLTLIREVLEGCQLCVSTDPVDMIRFGYLVQSAAEQPKPRQKQIRAALAELRGLELPGGVGFGFTLRDEHGSAGLTISKDMLYAPEATIGEFRRWFDALAGEPEAPARPGDARPTPPRPKPGR